MNILNGWKVDSFHIYDTEALRRYITKESVYPQGYEPSEADHSILNEIHFELPAGINIDAYNANVGYEGGCLLLPKVYEGDEQSTPAWWMDFTKG